MIMKLTPSLILLCRSLCVYADTVLPLTMYPFRFVLVRSNKHVLISSNISRYLYLIKSQSMISMEILMVPETVLIIPEPFPNKNIHWCWFN